MSDELTESGQEPVNAGVPTPNFTPPSGDKPTSENGLDVVLKRLEKIEGEIEKATRQSQSTHDKRIGRIERDLVGLRDTLSTYGVQGEQVDKAFAQMEYDELKQSVRDLVSGGNTGSVPNQRQATQTKAEQVSTALLHKAGIPLDDPEVAEMSKGNYDSPEDWYLALGVLVAKRRAGEPEITTSTFVASNTGGRPALVANKEKELETIAEKLIILYRSPNANADEITELSKRRKKLIG